MLCEITFNLFHIGKYLIQNLYQIIVLLKFKFSDFILLS